MAERLKQGHFLPKNLYFLLKIATMPNRRQLLQTGLTAAGGLLLPSITWKSKSNTIQNSPFRHSVSRWCFGDYVLEELCERAQTIGIQSIELLPPGDWATVQRYGLTFAVGTADFVSLTDGFNNPALHPQLQRQYKLLIEQAADQGVPQIIVFSGNRRGITDAEGIANSAIGLAPLVRQAERQGVTLVMELLNSKVDHPDHQCDHTPWGVALAEMIGSDHFKLLYDIYHMQIMEGDIIATIRKFHDYIAHYHTAGVPGRHEIDHTQELNYPAIMRAIAETGFTGFVGQEFTPVAKDPFKSLEEAVALCSVE